MGKGGNLFLNASNKAKGFYFYVYSLFVVVWGAGGNCVVDTGTMISSSASIDKMFLASRDLALFGSTRLVSDYLSSGEVVLKSKLDLF